MRPIDRHGQVIYGQQIYGQQIPSRNLADLLGIQQPRYDQHREQYEIDYTEALSVVRGNTVFYTVYSRVTDKGDPALIAFNKDGKRLFGFLDIQRQTTNQDSPAYQNRDGSVNQDYRARLQAEINLARKLRECLEQGDRFLVRLLYPSRKGSTYFFEPLINFLESDNVESAKGDNLVTRVQGYYPNKIIYNLPIIFVQLNENQELLGVGFVRRPEGDQQTFYYKRVLVRGAAGFIGRYIDMAIILSIHKGIIFAGMK